MNKITGIFILMFLVVGVVTAGIFLFPYSPDNPPHVDDSGYSEEGIKEVVNANNEFAFDLYSKLNENETKEENIFYSPYSISSAFAMVYEGARENTRNEIKNVFHFPDENLLRPNFAGIYNEINKKDKEYELSTGNALWAQQDYNFSQDYIERIEKYYGGKVANLDFVNEAEDSRKIINDFIEEQTEDRINDLIPAGFLNKWTRLVLTNAIYFKGTWEWEFEKSKTTERDFKITKNNIVKTQMMFMDNDKAMFNYADLEDLQILELPYKGKEISMLIILPTENLDSIKENLTAENLELWKSKMQETKLDAIYFPKFEFDTKYFMNDVLKEMGIVDSFVWKIANFSGMDGTDDLYIDFVIHQAYVKVDEKGTEAAAATAVGMIMGSAGPRSIFNADHPFIFLIQEKKTGNILFLGKVVDPRENEN